MPPARGKLIEVRPHESSSRSTAETIGSYRAMKGLCDPVEPTTVDLSSDDLIVIGTPVRACRGTPAIDAAGAARVGCQGRPALIGATCGGKERETLPILKTAPEAGGVIVVGEFVFDKAWNSGSGPDSRDDLDNTNSSGCTVKSVIYYFSGTGNSLAVAKRIAAALGDCGAGADRIPAEDEGGHRAAGGTGRHCIPVILYRPPGDGGRICRPSRPLAFNIHVLRDHPRWSRRFGSPAAGRRYSPGATGPRARCRIFGDDARQLYPDVQFSDRKRAGGDPREGGCTDRDDHGGGDPD